MEPKPMPWWGYLVMVTAIAVYTIGAGLAQGFMEGDRKQEPTSASFLWPVLVAFMAAACAFAVPVLAMCWLWKRALSYGAKWSVYKEDWQK